MTKSLSPTGVPPLNDEVPDANGTFGILLGRLVTKKSCAIRAINSHDEIDTELASELIERIEQAFRRTCLHITSKRELLFGIQEIPEEDSLQPSTDEITSGHFQSVT